MKPFAFLMDAPLVISWRRWQVSLLLFVVVLCAANTDWDFGRGASKSDEPFAQILRDDHSAPVWSLTFSGSRRLASSSSRELRVRDLETGQVVQLLGGRDSYGMTPAFSPDGRILAIATNRFMIRFWNAKSLTELEPMTLRQGPARAVAFSPDGAILAVAAWRSRQVTLFDWPERRPMATLDGSGGDVNVMAFAPDGTKLITADSASQVGIWDVAARRETAHWRAHASGITALALSPDGRLIATASYLDRAVCLWESEDGRSRECLAGAHASVTGLAFSPDSTKLVLSRSDGVASLWNLGSKRQIAEVKVATGSLQAIAFSADGQTIATAGFDGAVRYWDATLMVGGGARKP